MDTSRVSNLRRVPPVFIRYIHDSHIGSGQRQGNRFATMRTKKVQYALLFWSANILQPIAQMVFVTPFEIFGQLTRRSILLNPSLICLCLPSSLIAFVSSSCKCAPPQAISQSSWSVDSRPNSPSISFDNRRWST